MDELRGLTDRQSGVVARRQLLELGCTGAVLFLHLARAAARIYAEMATFKAAGVDGPA